MSLLVPSTTHPEPARPLTAADRAQRLSRRRLLAGAATTAGVAALGQAARGAGSALARQASPVAVQTGAALVEPRVLRSVDGRLDVALEASFSPVTMGGRTVTTYNFNGEVPGPTLRLRSGESMGVTLTNHLDEPTNLHTHGLHVSPAGNSDNVFVHLMPSETFGYEYAIPRDWTSGLYIPGFYWYHPHMHGTSAMQVEGGMAGALILEGELDDLPEIRDLPERLLVLQSTRFDDDSVMNFPNMDVVGIYVNGQSQPTLTIAPGETQRWRILNASSFVFVESGPGRTSTAPDRLGRQPATRGPQS